jgi:hypothetical protein
MNLRFPQNPTMRKLPEPMFEAEFDAATSLAFKCLLFNEEALCAGEIDLALKRLPSGDGPSQGQRFHLFGFFAGVTVEDEDVGIGFRLLGQ